MLIARSPLRISLLGGGSDLPEYYEKDEIGEVIGFAINKYIYLTANLPQIINKSILKYSDTEEFTDPNTISHPIFRSVLEKHWETKRKIEIASFADIKSGTGLGSSSIFTVTLLALIKSLKKESYTPFSLTKEGFDIERYTLGELVGLQDGAYGAYGGCCHFKFSSDDNISHSSINLTNKNIQKIQNSFFLVFTTISRSSKECLSKHTQSIENDKSKLMNQKEIVKLVKPGKIALLSSNFRELGEIIKESYFLKKTLNGSQNDKHAKIKEIEKQLNHQSIWGYKLLGAGGGGFFLVIGDGQECENYLKHNGLHPIKLSIENSGCKIIN